MTQRPVDCVKILWIFAHMLHTHKLHHGLSSLLHFVYELKREEVHLNDQLGVFVALWFLRLISVSVFPAHFAVAGIVLFWGACCWYSGLGVLTVDVVCFHIRGTLAALTVDDTSSCLLWSLNFSVLPLLFFSHCHLFPSAPHTLHLSHHYNPHLLLFPSLLLLILLISLSIISSFSFCSSSLSPSLPSLSPPASSPSGQGPCYKSDQTETVPPPCSDDKLHLKVLYIHCC